MTRLAPVPTDFVLDDLTWSLLIGSAVLLVAVAAVRISVRSGLPSLLIFLGIGLLLGESGLGIGFDSEELTQVLGYCALVLILAEGGLTTRWSSIRRSVAPAAVLSTVGVVVSVGVVAVAARYVLHLDWTVALLIGAILSSTDAAAVFSVLRTVPLPRRLSGMLEAESGFNDAPVVILVVALAAESVPTAEHHPWWYAPARGGRRAGRRDRDRAARRLGRGVAPATASRAPRPRCSRSGSSAWSSSRMPIAATVHTSGFIAAYLSALVLGNLGLPHRAAVHSFSSALGSIAQIGLFVLLGLLASPTELPEQIGPCRPHRAGPAARRPAAVRAGLADAVPDTAARPGLPVLGRPARRRPDRAGDRAGDAGHGRTPLASSTSSSSSSSSSPWSRPRPCPGWPGGSGWPSRSARSTSTSRPRRWRPWART